MQGTSRPTTRPPTGWAQLLFSSSGRIGRAPFVVAAAALLAVFAVYDQAVHGALRWATGWAVYPLLVFISACLLSKRLHDRGRSGWWAGLALWAFAAVWPRPHGVFGYLFALVLVWAAVELAARPGEPGPNRYGPPPR
jgi:uncharacterized membrane protein YhaH (DUF805 family)